MSSLGLFDEQDIPSRAEIIEHAQGSIYELDVWLESLGLPVGVKNKIYSDLESYGYDDDINLDDVKEES